MQLLHRKTVGYRETKFVESKDIVKLTDGLWKPPDRGIFTMTAESEIDLGFASVRIRCFISLNPNKSEILGKQG